MIVVNARFLTQPITGVQRYATEIAYRLKTYCPAIQFWAPANIIHHDIAKKLDVQIIGSLTGTLWEQCTLPYHLPSQALLINLCNTAPILHSKQLNTIHDMAYRVFPMGYNWSFRWWYNMLIPLVAKRCCGIITVSRSSATSISELLGASPNRITIAHNGFSHLSANHTRTATTHDAFALTVGSLEPRKNLEHVIRGFLQAGIPNLRLVIVGRLNLQSFQSSPSLQALINDNPSIVLRSHTSDKELEELYEQAQFLLYLPHYEGFGIPPGEAMYKRCPVILSAIPVFNEIYKDAACYVNPTDINAIAQAIQSLAEPSAYRNELIEKGLSKAAEYSWDKSAHTIWKLIQQHV